MKGRGSGEGMALVLLGGLAALRGGAADGEEGAGECAVDDEVDPPVGWVGPQRCGIFLCLYGVEGLLLFLGLWGRGVPPLISAGLTRAAAVVARWRGEAAETSRPPTTTVYVLFVVGVLTFGLAQRLIAGEACYGWCGCPVVWVPVEVGDVVFSVFMMLSAVVALHLGLANGLVRLPTQRHGHPAASIHTV